MSTTSKFSFITIFMTTSLVVQSAYSISFRNPFNNNKVKVGLDDVVRGGAAVATGGLSEIEFQRQEKEAKEKAERQRQEAERQIREQELQAKRQAYAAQMASDQEELQRLQELEKQTSDAVGRLLWVHQVVGDEVKLRQGFVGGVRSVYNRYLVENPAYQQVLRDLAASTVSADKMSGAVDRQSLAQDPLDTVTQEVANYLVELDERTQNIVLESVHQGLASDVTALHQATQSAHEMLSKFYQLVLSQRIDAEARIANLQSQLSQL